MARRSTPVALTALLWLLLVSMSSAEEARFTSEPTNSTVGQGDDIYLQCHVHAPGRTIIWVFHPETGGDYKRLALNNINWVGPSQTLKVDEDLGRFDLIIHNVTLEQQGRYECRIMPLNTANFLSASAYVVVMAEPETLLVNDVPDGTSLEVKADSGAFVLLCVAYRARPAAEITWYRNGGSEPLTAGVNSSVQTTTLESGVVLYNTLSQLALSPDADDRGSRYTCSASHPLLFGTPLTTTVTLDVFYAPNPPEILGLPEVTGSEVRVQKGAVIDWRCRVRGGSPRPTVYWHKNDVPIQLESRREDESVVSKLPVFNADENDNGAKFKCFAENKATRPTTLSQTVTLIVQYPPAEVTITGRRSAKSGETVTLNCTSSPSNPVSQLRWFVDGQIRTPDTSETVQLEDGSYISYSLLSIRVQASLSGSAPTPPIQVMCQADNYIDSPVLETTRVAVAYPPNKPVIEASTVRGYISEDTPTTILCKVTGGFPVPNVTWWKDGVNLNESVTSVMFSGIPRVSYSFTPRREDNGAVLECRAENDATAEPVVTQHVLNVSFAPRLVNVTQLVPLSVAGREHTAVCRTSAANPAPTLIWVKNSIRVPSDLYNTNILPSDHNGLSSVSELKFRPEVEDDGMTLNCLASNQLPNSDISNGVILNVNYAPYFPRVETNYNIKENESMLLSFQAIGKPEVEAYTWFFKGNRLGASFHNEEAKSRVSLSPRLSASSHVFNITFVLREDAGLYRVEANNTFGIGALNFTINVQYPALIGSAPETVIVTEGETANITCLADAYPAALMDWKRDHYDWSRASTETSPNSIVLSIRDVRASDVGIFTCEVWNGFGSTKNKASSALLVNYAPVEKESPRRFTSSPGKSAELHCNVTGGATVDFYWARVLDDGRELQLSSARHTVTSFQLGLDWFSAVLHIDDVTRADFGNYTCKAYNQRGEDTQTLVLLESSVPEVPNELELVNRSHDAIGLRLTPGFDGGYAQHYLVRYRARGAEGYTEKEVVPHGSTVVVVSGLSRGTSYEFEAKARNELGDSDYTHPALNAETRYVVSGETDELEEKDDVPLIVILCVSIIGMVLLALNVLLILYLMRRRRRRLRKAANGAVSDSSERTDYGDLSTDLAMYTTPSDDSHAFDRSVSSSLEDDSDAMRRMYTPSPLDSYVSPGGPPVRPLMPVRSRSPPVPRPSAVPPDPSRTFLLNSDGRGQVDDRSNESEYREQLRSTALTGLPLTNSNSPLNVIPEDPRPPVLSRTQPPTTAPPQPPLEPSDPLQRQPVRQGPVHAQPAPLGHVQPVQAASRTAPRPPERSSSRGRVRREYTSVDNVSQEQQPRRQPPPQPHQRQLSREMPTPSQQSSYAHPTSYQPSGIEPLGHLV